MMRQRGWESGRYDGYLTGLAAGCGGVVVFVFWLFAADTVPPPVTHRREPRRTREPRPVVEPEPFEDEPLKIEVCKDKHGTCAQWAAEGECQRNRPYMQGTCGHSCGMCRDLETEADKIRTAVVTQRIFFDISIEDRSVGRIVVGLFGNDLPKTTAKIVKLATCSEKPPAGCYRGTVFHRIIPGFMVQGGMTRQARWDDEAFPFKHAMPGLISLANAGPNTNGAEFFITTSTPVHLDGKHVVFGRVLKGMSVVTAIEREGTPDGRPKERVEVTNCG
eukprot:Hpha_TRINITY_DN15927_c5_g1::TRINITY_DN15927_c5_g1_i1::g.74232::m.74232/K01802/E5.2.1.8; peptidylprolyl isomerase